MLSRRLAAVALFTLMIVPPVDADELAWERLLEEGSGILTSLSAGERLEVRLDVVDRPVSAFEVHAQGATVSLSLDGRHLRTFSDEAARFDLALAPGAHALVWSALSTANDATVEIVDLGAVVTRATEYARFPSALTGCTERPLDIDLRSSAPIASATVLVDGVAAQASTSGTLVGLRVLTRVSVALPPPAPGGAWREVGVLATDILGNTWTLPTLDVWHDVAPRFAAPRDGWVYDPRPTIALRSECSPDEIASIEATLDGRPVALEATSGTWTIPMAHEWTYEETHAYAFTATLADGSTHPFTGSLREGLDRIDVPLGSELLWSARGGQALLVAGSRLAVGALAPIPDTAGHLATDSTTTARAYYAPRELLCTLAHCVPYGGGAPGFLPTSATLVVPTPEGDVAIPAFGQLAASALGAP